MVAGCWLLVVGGDVGFGSGGVLKRRPVWIGVGCWLMRVFATRVRRLARVGGFWSLPDMSRVSLAFGCWLLVGRWQA